MTTYIVDHAKRALALLGSKVRSVEYVEEIVRALANEVQVLEDAIYDVAISRSVEGAYGAQLDLLGNLVGEPREGLTDILYRRFIAGAIQVRRSTGTGPQIIELVRTLTGSTDVRLINGGGAGYIVEYAVPVTIGGSLRNRVKDRITRATAAGVGVQLVEVVAPSRLDGDGFILDIAPGFDGPGMGDAF